MLEDLLKQALTMNETEQGQFIRTLASQSDIPLGELNQILFKLYLRYWRIALDLFEAIGSPRNTPAIPGVVFHLTEMNTGIYNLVLKLTSRLNSALVIPHLIGFLWNRGGLNPPVYADQVRSICIAIINLGKAYAVSCAPVIVSLMNSNLQPPLDLEPMLRVIELLDPNESHYAIPALIHCAQTNADPDSQTLAQQLLTRFPSDILANYANVYQSSTKTD